MQVKNEEGAYRIISGKAKCWGRGIVLRRKGGTSERMGKEVSGENILRIY